MYLHLFEIITTSFLRRYGSSLSDSDGGKPGRRHSHTIVNMTESNSPPQLPSPTRPLHLSTGKAPLTNVGECSFGCQVLNTFTVQALERLRLEIVHKPSILSLIIRILSLHLVESPT